MKVKFYDTQESFPSSVSGFTEFIGNTTCVLVYGFESALLPGAGSWILQINPFHQSAPKLTSVGIMNNKFYKIKGSIPTSVSGFTEFNGNTTCVLVYGFESALIPGAGSGIPLQDNLTLSHQTTDTLIGVSIVKIEFIEELENPFPSVYQVSLNLKGTRPAFWYTVLREPEYQARGVGFFSLMS